MRETVIYIRLLSGKSGSLAVDVWIQCRRVIVQTVYTDIGEFAAICDAFICCESHDFCESCCSLSGDRLWTGDVDFFVRASQHKQHRRY